MGERTRGIAATALRLVVGLAIIFGLRQAHGAEIAMPPQLAVEVGGSEPSLAIPILVAQSMPGSSGSADSGVSATAASTEPQSSTQEAISIPRMPSPNQKRRRPKMAGIPDGLRPADQFPDDSAATQQAATQEQQPVGTSTMAGAASTQNAEGQYNLAEDDSETTPISDYESPGARAARKAEAQSTAGRKYKLAPISWRATVFYTIAFRQYKVWGDKNYLFNEHPDIRTRPRKYASIQQTKGALMEASTFVLHPWVATVGGHLGVILEDDHPIPNTSNNHNNQLLYGAEFHLFPVTRFPFAMTYDHSTTNADYQTTVTDSNNNNVTDTLFMSQKYKPLRGPDQYDFSYRYNKTAYKYAFNTIDFNTPLTASAFSYSVFSGSYSSRLGKNYDQPFNMFGSHIVATQTPDHTSDSVTDDISATHLYSPEEYLLTLTNNANYFQSRSSRFKTRNLMLSSEGIWQPEDLDNPLVVEGKASYFRVQNETINSSSDNQILNAAVKATYNKWSDLRLSGGAGLTETHSLGRTSLSTILFGRAIYVPPATILKNYSYTKSATTGFTNSTSSSGDENFSTSSGVSHSLASRGHSFKLFDRNFLFSNQFSQSLTVTTDRLRGSSETLVNAASLRWVPLGMRTRLPGTQVKDKGMGLSTKAKIRGSANLVTSVNVSARDSRTYGRRPSHSQHFRLSLNGGAGSAYSAVASTSGYGAQAELGIDYSYTTSSGGSGGLSGNASWGHSFFYDYRYQRRRVFNIPRLNYTFRLKASLDPSVLARRRSDIEMTQIYATNTKVAPYGASLEQLLSYKIGQNMVVLSGSIVNDYGINTATLFLQFRAWRNLNN